MLRNITVVGTGLIGASAALAARRAGASVRGWDPDPDVLRVAHEREAVEPAATLADAVEGADLVLIAAPVAELPHVVREVLALAPDGCVVTDVGSTKSAVCAAAAGDGALHRRPSDLRRGDARPRAGERGAVRGRDLVPDADRRDGARSCSAPCTAS